MKPSKTTRARAGAAALLAVIATAGCTATSPFQTEKPMALGDGVMLDVGDLEIRNLALVSGEGGGEAVLTGTVGNLGSEDSDFQVMVGEGEPLEATVPAGGVVNLSADGEKLTVPSVEEPPGSMVEIAVGPAGELTPVTVPVLDPAGYYEDFAPEGWTPTPEPTESETSDSH